MCFVSFSLLFRAPEAQKIKTKSIDLQIPTKRANPRFIDLNKAYKRQIQAVLSQKTSDYGHSLEFKASLLSSWAVGHFLGESISPVDRFDPNELIETGYLSEDYINPLISHYIVSGDETSLEMATNAAEFVLDHMQSVIPPTFIEHGSTYGALGSEYTYLEDAGSFYVTLSALYNLTKSEKYLRKIENFIFLLKKNSKQRALPFKFRYTNAQADKLLSMNPQVKLLMNLAKISKLVAKLDVSSIIEDQMKLLDHENPLEMRTKLKISSTNIENCHLGIFDTNLSSSILDLCKKQVKKGRLPVRLSQKSYFGGSPVIAHFAFETEVVDLLWKAQNTDTATKVLEEGMQRTIFNNRYHGLTNVTYSQPVYDNISHPRFFSNWLLTRYLIDSLYPYDSLIRSENGHILFMSSR